MASLHRQELREAAVELDEAVAWYARRSDLIAAEFVRAVSTALQRIEEWPDAGRPYAASRSLALTVRTRRVPGFPYQIAYLVDGDLLVIVAYPHEKRRPGYWEDRVHT